MASVNLVQTNFTAGEVSPRMLGRIDVERYKNGVAEMYNFLPLIHGGAKSAPLRRYNGTAKNGDKKCRLIRFKFSRAEANMLEVGEGYIRFFNADRTQVMDGMSPYEIANPYSESDLFELEFEGLADTILIFHPDYYPRRLRRFANDNWVLDQVPFDPEPFFEQGHKPSETLTLSAATVGTGRTFTAGGASFLAADVGRRITHNGGVALITGYTSTTVVTCTIETAFESTSVAADVWTIEGTPQAVCTPSKNGTVGESITLTLTTGTLFGQRYTLSSATFDGGASPPEVEFNTLVDVSIATSDTVRIDGCVPFEYDGIYEVISTGTGFRFTVNLAPDPGPITTYGTVQKVTTSTSKAGWRSEDVGSFVEINGGLIEITSYSSSSQVVGTVRQAMTSDVGAQASAWTLNQTIWNDVNGYPRTGGFFQQRLFVGGSPAYPHSITASVTGQYYNFELGTDDDKGFMYDLDVAQYDPILHINRNKRQLVVQTSGNEYALSGSIENPMTPTSVQVEDPTDWGSNTVKPVRVGNELVFVNYTGLKVRALGYRFENDSFTSPDLTKLSEHITTPGIVDIAYQKEPESIVWAVRSDGVLVTLSIDRDEGVLAWARQIADGEYESVAVIPNELGVDEVWVSVKRTIDGSTVRYIESFDSEYDFALHSAITGTSVGGTDTITGLDHLEAETVYAVCDGVVMGPLTVSSGQVALERNVNSWAVGSFMGGYIKTLNPEFVTQVGSAQGNNIRIGSTNLRMLQSVSVKLNGQYLDRRQFGGGLLDQPPPSFTSDVDVTNLGWYKNGYNVIEQGNPLPAHILSIIMKLTVNN